MSRESRGRWLDAALEPQIAQSDRTGLRPRVNVSTSQGAMGGRSASTSGMSMPRIRSRSATDYAVRQHSTPEWLGAVCGTCVFTMA